MMTALCKREAQPGLWLDQVPIPQIGINEVLIKIDRTGICGTDLHIYNWDEWARKTVPIGLTVGHEFVGVIEAVGQNVKDFSKGDIVSGEGHVVCGRCRNCLAGRRHLCADTQDVKDRGLTKELCDTVVSHLTRLTPNSPNSILKVCKEFHLNREIRTYFA